MDGEEGAQGTKRNENKAGRTVEKPDENSYKKKLAEIEKALADATLQVTNVRTKLVEVGGRGKGSEEMTQLRQCLETLQKELTKAKAEKRQYIDQARGIEDNIRRETDSLKVCRSKLEVKSVEEVDTKIARLEREVESGTMRIVDENKALRDISALRILRKTFAKFDIMQNQINADRAKLENIRKIYINEPVSKALSDEISTLRDKISLLRGLENEIYSSRNELVLNRNKLQKKRDEIYEQKKALQNKYYHDLHAYHEYESEARKAAAERRQIEREQYEKEKRSAAAAARLEAANEAAFGEEIYICENLVLYFSSNNNCAVQQEDTKIATEAVRSIKENGPQGEKFVLKEDLESPNGIFFGSLNNKSKKKKGKNAIGARTEPTKLQLNMVTMDQLSKVGVSVPLSVQDNDRVITDLKARIEYYIKNQENKTQENIAKAKPENELIEQKALQKAAAAKIQTEVTHNAKTKYKRPSERNIPSKAANNNL